MDNFIPAPCIPDEGIAATIPGSPFSVLSLIETQYRLRVSPNAPLPTPEILSRSLNLSLAQVYAALAYYHANQAAFEAERTRRQQAGEQALAELFGGQKRQRGWVEIYEEWPGDESDAEIEAALERLS